MMATWLLSILVFSVCAALSSLGVLLAWPSVQRRSQTLHPRTRSRLAVATAVAPLVVASTVVLSCLLPGVLELLGGVRDHCTEHGDHLHLCMAHPTAALSPGLFVVSIGLMGPLAFAATRRTRALVSALRPAAALRRAASERIEPDIRLLRSPRCFSLTTGLLRPVIIVSSGMVDALAPERLNVVYAHERAHARRRDSLVRCIAAVASFPLLPRCRRAILDELELASELACDDDSARIVGDRLLVAETLIDVERIGAALSHPLPEASPGIAGSKLPARVRGLLEEPVAEPSNLLWMGLWVVPLGVLLSTGLVHHTAEHLLALAFGQH